MKNTNFKHIEEISKFHKILSNPNRLIIIKLLIEKPHTVEEIAGKLKADHGLASFHLRKMQVYGFLKIKKEKQFVTYSISDKRIIRMFELSIDLTN